MSNCFLQEPLFSNNLHENRNYHDDGEDDDFLSLTLSLSPYTSPTPPPLQLSPSHPLLLVNNDNHQAQPQQQQPALRPPTTRRPRHNPKNSAPRKGKSSTVTPPFPWATNRRATVQTLNYLTSNGIHTITGQVQCKRCEKQFEVGFELENKFYEVGSFFLKHKVEMNSRAPSEWLSPRFIKCKYCKHDTSVRPLMGEKKREINWLFLLLGQMLGCCTLDQLKYFCKHTKNHRTGAKDRVLYLTYVELCKQLVPHGPFSK